MSERQTPNEKAFWERTSCRSCGKQGLKEILSLGNQHLADWSVEKKDPIYIPLTVCRCESCSLVQLKHTTEPKLLYNADYGYRSGVNATMREELAEIAETGAKMVDLKDGDFVLDIGSNDGTLLKSYSPRVTRVGYEPIKAMTPYYNENFKQFKASEWVVFKDFFRPFPFVHRFDSTKAKVATAIAMFYDLDEPNKFLDDVRSVIDEQGILIIQQNYLPAMLNQNAFDNILHEHLGYYSLSTLESLLKKHDLEIFDIKINKINGGSFRTYVKQEGAVLANGFDDQARLDQVRKLEERMDDDKIFEDFAERVKTLTSDLHNLIEEEVSDGKKVYIYGASTRGNTLLQAANLDSNLIAGAAERNPNKWGKITVGTNIPIFSEEEARQKADTFLVLPWFFKDEFIQREKEFIDNGGRLIFPLPSLEVIQNGKN